MSKYVVDVFAEGNVGGFPENTYRVGTADEVAKIVRDCTRRIAGVGRVVVNIKEKDDPGKPKADKMDEQVLVFSAKALEGIGMAGKTGMLFSAHEGFLGCGDYVDTLRFMRRGDAENDQAFKQPIPYWVVVDPSRNPGDGGDRILCYVRGKKSGEGRLVAKASIGIGGHISMEDVDESLWVKGGRFSPKDAALVYELGSLRELHEELRITASGQGRIVAMLNDDRTPVGRVHFGFVHVFVPTNPEGVGPNEDDVVTQFSWKTVGELIEIRDSLEGWSQMCLDNIGQIIAEARKLTNPVATAVTKDNGGGSENNGA